MRKSYSISPYTLANLINIFVGASKASKEAIKQKFICFYFRNYFKALKAKTIIVENHYIDHDFLEDFAGYYVKCFKPYERTCVRLHFFDIKFNKNDFNNLLRGDDSLIDEKILNTAYLGFVVVKPLPQTIIGRTCLKTYNDKKNGRNYPITRPYNANLYGIELSVNSLAFQEQDNVVAACATSALWSAFHVSGKLYQHPILSPVELTKAACDSLPLESRFLPNKGLTMPQMAHAIRSVNLEPFLINALKEDVLKSTLYAYLKGGVPLILTVLLVDMSTKVGKFVGKHAVTITGFNIDKKQSPVGSERSISLQSLRINKIYAHDDQIGPFSRIVLDKQVIGFEINNAVVNHISMNTSWRGKNHTIGSMRAVAEDLLIPIYNKIRIPLSDIEDAIYYFDEFIDEFQCAGNFPLNNRFEWDIYLSQTNSFKKDILKKTNLNKKLKSEILTEPMPKFLWRAEASCDGKPVLELVFDATDILQGLSLKRAIGFDINCFEFLRKITNQAVIIQQYKDSPAWMILDWFRKA